VPSDFLIRNQGSFAAAGIPTIVATSGSEAASVAAAETQKGRRVVIVGMSRGALMAANAIASGARPAGVVFVSAGYDGVMGALGSPAVLPRTLVVHHRRDACNLTPPSGVAQFTAFAGGRASVRWIDNTGAPAPNPCGPFGAHGFYTKDSAAVGAIVGFVKAR
jgi:dienelactone hydrolase